MNAKASPNRSLPVDVMEPIPFRVLAKRKELGDTYTLDLQPVSGAKHFAFQPGQFNMLYVFGVGEVPISISGDPAKPEKLVHTVRTVGATSNALVNLKKGDVVGVRGPFGAPWPVEAHEGNDIVIIAGGIGLAPLRPSIYHVLNNRDKYGRLVILYGARSPKDILFLKELQTWRGRLDTYVDVSVDHAGGDWSGNVGPVTRLIPRANFDAHHATAMVCGPEIMMRFTVPMLLEAGMSKDDIFVSMERNMKCAVGHCGHCQLGGQFVCKDGPVFPYTTVEPLMRVKGL